MENNPLSSFKKAIKNWWVSLLVGIIALIVGSVCMFTPFSTFAALTILFIAAFLAGGISDIIFAISNRDVMTNWGWTLAMGIINVLFGILLLNNMTLAPITLCYFIAFWMLIQSIWGIGMSVELQRVPYSNWGWLLALSILSLLASIMLLFQPAVAGLFASYIIAFMFVFYGIFRIVMSFRLKSMKKYLPEDKE